MASHSLCLFLVLTLVSSQTSWAQIYRYRAPDGRWVISDRAPADDAEDVVEEPEGAGPSVRTTAPMPSRRARTSISKRYKRKAARRHKRQRHAETPRPVSTRQLGLLAIGSSRAAVRRKLGPPLDKVREGKKKRMVRLKGRYVQRKVSIETWYYPGSNRLRPAQLVFYNGLLAEKDKSGY